MQFVLIFYMHRQYAKEVKLRVVRFGDLFTILTKEIGLGLWGRLNHGRVIRKSIGKLMKDMSFLERFIYTDSSWCWLCLYTRLWNRKEFPSIKRNLCLIHKGKLALLQANKEKTELLRIWWFSASLVSKYSLCQSVISLIAFTKLCNKFSELFSSCKSKTLCPLQHSSSFFLISNPWQPPFYFLSILIWLL